MRRDRFASPADLAACRALIREGSHSFHAASRLLPARVRTGAFALYAFCRVSDDMIDLQAGSGAAIARLTARLDLAYAGAPADSPVDRALADAVAEFNVPKSLLLALIEGLSWDVSARRYETIDDLNDYAARVAGSVGAMMAALMDARSLPLAARACDLGVAMQFTNIARDVGEDARAGRLYLPRAWMREAGLDPDAFLADPAPSPALTAVTERLLRHADALYRRADAGIAGLALAYRPAIAAARRIYAEIGEEVRQLGMGAFQRRARVNGRRKLFLCAVALAQAVSPGPAAHAMDPPLPQTRFLAEALGGPSRAYRPSHAQSITTPWQWVDVNWGWVWDLFARMGERERTTSRI